MSAMASQITGVTIVYSTVCHGADQRKHLSFASLAFVMEIHRWPVDSPHKGQVTRKMVPFDDIIMDFVPDISHVYIWWWSNLAYFQSLPSLRLGKFIECDNTILIHFCGLLFLHKTKYKYFPMAIRGKMFKIQLIEVVYALNSIRTGCFIHSNKSPMRDHVFVRGFKGLYRTWQRCHRMPLKSEKNGFYPVLCPKSTLIQPTWSAYPYHLVFLIWYPYSLVLLIWYPYALTSLYGNTTHCSGYGVALGCYGLFSVTRTVIVTSQWYDRYCFMEYARTWARHPTTPWQPECTAITDCQSIDSM